MADSYVIAVGWLLRETELSNVVADDKQIFIDGPPGQELVTLFLPTSKTDQAGRGAARRLAHECGRTSKLERCDGLSCPVCAVLRQVNRLMDFFELKDKEALFEAQLPLFPRKDGTKPAKAQVVEAWRDAADPKFNLRPSGHSARRSGAKRRARLGWSLWQIQFLGRWAASTVLEYVEEAMAELTSEWAVGDAAPTYEAASSSSAVQSCLLGSSGGAPQLSSRVDKLEALIAALQEQQHIPVPPAAPVDARPAVQCVLSRGKAHRMPEGVLEWPRPLWTSACGWRCGAAFSLQVVTEDKLSLLRHTKCARMGCWPARLRQDGGELAPAGGADSPVRVRSPS